MVDQHSDELTDRHRRVPHADVPPVPATHLTGEGADIGPVIVCQLDQRSTDSSCSGVP
jgi:hypothetical protein